MCPLKIYKFAYFHNCVFVYLNICTSCSVNLWLSEKQMLSSENENVSTKNVYIHIFSNYVFVYLYFSFSEFAVVWRNKCCPLRMRMLLP